MRVKPTGAQTRDIPLYMSVLNIFRPLNVRVDGMCFLGKRPAPLTHRNLGSGENQRIKYDIVKESTGHEEIHLLMRESAGHEQNNM